MTRSKKLLAAALSVMTVGTALTATTQQAAAFPHGPHGHFGHHGWGHHGWGRGFGWGAGALAVGALGALAVERAYDCRLIRQYDEFGNYIGRVRVCD